MYRAVYRMFPEQSLLCVSRTLADVYNYPLEPRLAAPLSISVCEDVFSPRFHGPSRIYLAISVESHFARFSATRHSHFRIITLPVAESLGLMNTFSEIIIRRYKHPLLCSRMYRLILSLSIFNVIMSNINRE